nr:MAG TPA: hypothetical protein [Caudoviricetes sp.]
MIILVRGLNILILCGFVGVGIMNPLKQIFKKHDVGLTITLAFIIFVFIYSGVSWFIPLD